MSEPTPLEKMLAEKANTGRSLVELDPQHIAEVLGMLSSERKARGMAEQREQGNRHAYRPETRDWNLVARAIRILEEATTPGAADALRGKA
jgi:hypothetical protein